MSLRLDRAVWTLGLLALSLVAPGAWAGDEDLDRAKRLFEAGDKAEQAGNCEEAVARFRDVLALKQTPQVHLRIGRCLDRLGKLSSALESYQTAISLAAGNQAVLDVANGQLKSIDARVPRLTLALKGPKARIVKLDGAETSALDKPLPLDPGTHRVDAEAPGHEPFTKSIELSEGARETVEITLKAIVVAPPPPPESTLTPWPFVLLGVSGVTLAVLGSSSLEETYTHCDPPDANGTRTCPPQYEEDIDGVQVQFAISGVMGALSGLALAGGITWLIVDLTSTPSADPASPPVAVIPWITPGSGGAFVSGAF